MRAARPLVIAIAAALLSSTLVASSTAPTSAATAGNSDFIDQWYLHNPGYATGIADIDIDAPAAWDITTDCTPIVIAVIDSGVDYRMPELSQSMWVNEAEKSGMTGIDDDGNGYIDDVHGYDFGENDGDILPDYSGTVKQHYVTHGTLVAEVIAARGEEDRNTNADASRIAGVCWTAQIMALKVAKTDSSWPDDAESRAVDYVNMMHQRGVNVKVVNYSAGNYDAPDSAGNVKMLKALQQLRANGILFVTAAGNEHKNNDAVDNFPSNFSKDLDNVISVAATDISDRLWPGSDYGEQNVNLAAPGAGLPLPEPAYFFTWEDLGKTPASTAIIARQFSKILGHLIRIETLNGPVYPLIFSAGDVSAVKPNGDREIMVELKDGRGIKLNLSSDDSKVSISGQGPTGLFFTSHSLKVLKRTVAVGDKVEVKREAFYSPFTAVVYGTSFSAPQVAGAAALLFSHYGDETTYLDVRDRILKGADVLNGLRGKLQTSGRLNAYNGFGAGNIEVMTYEDRTDNGIFDAGDVPLSGVPITLFSLAAVKFPDDESPQQGSEYLLTESTGLDGKAAFRNVLAGPTMVSARPVPGLVLTTPSPVTLNVVAGQDTSLNFVYQYIGPPRPSVSGKVFLDFNGNGSFEPETEQPASGVPVDLTGSVMCNYRDPQGEIRKQEWPLAGRALTRGDGTYTLSLEGQACLSDDSPDVFASYPASIEVSAESSSRSLTLSKEQVLEGIDFAASQKTGKVSGGAFKGILLYSGKFRLDSDNPKWQRLGLAGITVGVYAHGHPATLADDKQFEAVTGAGGTYSFDGVPAGQVFLYVKDPGIYQLQQAMTYKYMLNPGGQISNADFGFLDRPGQVSGYVFEDANKNRVFDKGERGLTGSIKLTAYSPADGTTVSQQTVTRLLPGGYFAFEGVTPGKVVLDKPHGGDFGSEETTPGTGSYSFDLAPGQIRKNMNFGYTGAITGIDDLRILIDPPRLPLPFMMNVTAYDDANANNRRDAGEQGLEGVSFRIENLYSRELAVITTNRVGIANYTIFDITDEPPPYTISVERERAGYATGPREVTVYPNLSASNVRLGVPAVVVNDFEFASYDPSGLRVDDDAPLPASTHALTLESGETIDLEMESTSQVTGLALDQESNRITFRVEGETGTTGVTRVPVGRILSGPYTVMMDGQPFDDFEVLQRQGETIIKLTYTHSVHEVTVTGASVVPEFPAALMAALVALSLVAVITLGRLRFYRGSLQ